MTAPGDVVGQAVVNVRTCADLYRMGKAMTPACQFRIPATPSFRCAGCQGDGTWLDTSNPTTVKPSGAWLTAERDGKPWCNHDAHEWCAMPDDAHERHPLWREAHPRPVENGDTDGDL